MNTISKTIRLFLDSIGRRSEYEFYLKKFQSNRSPCFALVVPDSGSIQDSGELMSFDLHFLLRLELCPLVVLFGEQADGNAQELARHGATRMLGPSLLTGSPEDIAAITSECIREETIPVLNLPDHRVEDLVPLVAPNLSTRIHVLRTSGMLHSPTGEKLFYLYLKRRSQTELLDEDVPVVDRASHWLNQHPTLHISVSSPLYLLQEMFTVKGRGSIIRPGSDLLRFSGIAEVDQDRLVRLIEDSFGKSLSNPDCLQSACEIVLESGYRGAVLLEAHASGKYLSKFAVGTQARGEGVAQELWDAACASQEKLFWRSRTENPINQWYERHATGHHVSGDWTVFWRGISPSDLPAIIDDAVSRPSDFAERGRPRP
jgi:hypothetical protein